MVEHNIYLPPPGDGAVTLLDFRLLELDIRIDTGDGNGFGLGFTFNFARTPCDTIAAVFIGPFLLRIKHVCKCP